MACHQFGFLERYDMLKHAAPGGMFLLNTPYGRTKSGSTCQSAVQEQIIDKNVTLYVDSIADASPQWRSKRSWAAASTR